MLKGRIKNIAICLFLCLFLFGCSKNEEKILGFWEVSKIYKNDVETKDQSPSQIETLWATWSFYQTKALIIRYFEGTVSYQGDGTWDFEGKNNSELVVSLHSKNENIERRYKVSNFKSNEIHLSFTDSKGVNWRLLLTLTYSLRDVYY